MSEFLEKIAKIKSILHNNNYKYYALWLDKWENEYEYLANEVELLSVDNVLFLIPHADRKPIKLIMA
jgi:hypothetical protein